MAHRKRFAAAAGIALLVFIVLLSLSLGTLKSVAAALLVFLVVYAAASANILAAFIAHRQLTVAEAEAAASRQERSRKPDLDLRLWLRGPHTEAYYPGGSPAPDGRFINYLGIHIYNGGARVTSSVHVSILVPNDLNPELAGGYSDIPTFVQGLTTFAEGRYWHEFHHVVTTPIHPGQSLQVGQVMVSGDRPLPAKLLWSLQSDQDHYPADCPYGEVPVVFTSHGRR